MTFDPDEAGHAYKWGVMAAVGTGILTATLNISIINISLPMIRTDFGASVAAVEWVVLIYSLVLAVLLVIVGRLSDIFGRKKLYVAGALIFAGGSLLCGLSGSLLQLVLSRGVQAIGGALMVGNSTAIITDAFPSRELGRALGITSSIVAIGTTVGPTLGGFILEHTNWPMIFFVSVPMGVLAATLASFILRAGRLTQQQRFDLWGALTLALFLLTGLLSVTYGQETHWQDPRVVWFILACVVFGLVFGRVELHTPEPVLQLLLFRNRLIAAALLSCFLYFVSIAANTFLMPFMLQTILGYSVQKTGLFLICVPLTIALVAPISGWLSDEIGSRVLAALGLAIVSFALFSLSRLNLGSTDAAIAIRLVLLGLGSGIFQSPNNSSLMNSVPRDKRGVAGGLLATARHLGLMFGIALAGAVWTGRSSYHAVRAGFQTPELPTPALLAGMQDALFVAGTVAGIATFLSWARGKQPAKAEVAYVRGSHD